ncbi:MAG: hypothetical protein KDI90_11730 [Alphaproteobacteria bacterium]|nr:hypothetical protein [Alphaproteobacteria bacterium]
MAQAQDALPDASGVSTPDPTDILTEEMKASEQAYNKVRDTLDEKQKATIKDVENAYLLALAPEIEVARLSMQLKSCPYKDKSKKAEDASIFAAYKLEKKREAQDLKEKAAKKYKDKTEFIDPAVLTKHLTILTYFGKHVSLQALAGQLAGKPADQLCKEGRTTLLAYSNL